MVSLQCVYAYEDPVEPSVYKPCRAAVTLERLFNHMCCKIVFIHSRFSGCNERTLFATKDVSLTVVLSGVSKL